MTVKKIICHFCRVLPARQNGFENRNKLYPKRLISPGAQLELSSLPNCSFAALFYTRTVYDALKCRKVSAKLVAGLQNLLYLSVNTRCDWLILRAVFSTKLFLLPKCFVIYRQVFLTFIANKSLKLYFTSKIVC